MHSFQSWAADRQVLEKALDSLPVDGFSIEIKRVVKSGLDVCDFNVVLDKAHENHDHDMEYLHGKEAPENTGPQSLSASRYFSSKKLIV